MWNWRGTLSNTPYVLKLRAPKEQRYWATSLSGWRSCRHCLEQAKANLVDSPRGSWNRVAREENDGNIDLIDGNAKKKKFPPAQKADFDKGRQSPAIAALKRLQYLAGEDSFAKEKRLAPGKKKTTPRKFDYTAFRRGKPRNRCWRWAGGGPEVYAGKRWPSWAAPKNCETGFG